MINYLDCWISAASQLFSQALAGEPTVSECKPDALPKKAFAFVIEVQGEAAGKLTLVLDKTLLDTPLMGEGADQKASWIELLREAADSAAGDMLAREKVRCRVAKLDELADGSWERTKVERGLELRSGDQSWLIVAESNVRAVAAEAPARSANPIPPPVKDVAAAAAAPPRLSPGVELLLDVELDTSLRFGSREMVLGQLLELGPGDVVPLDRHVADPVDLIVGDKIVARGEVVLVNGNFGLRVTEVAEPRKRLESIRCLF